MIGTGRLSFLEWSLTQSSSFAVQPLVLGYQIEMVLIPVIGIMGEKEGKLEELLFSLAGGINSMCAYSYRMHMCTYAHS